MVRSAQQPLTARGGSFVIAASDATQDSQKSADITCSGSDDQAQINFFLAKLRTTGDVDVKGSGEVTRKNQGGCIQLTEGSFKLSSSIDFTGLSNITIRGVGPSTVIHNQNTAGLHAIEASNTVVSNQVPDRCYIQDMLIQGVSGSGDGLHIEGIEYLYLHGLHCQDNGGKGAHLESFTGTGDPGADNPMISNCWFQFNGSNGLYIEKLHEVMITSCHIEENTGVGLHLQDCVGVNIANCNIEDHTGVDGITSDSSTLRMTGCEIEDNITITTAGLVCSGTTISGTLDITASGSNRVFLSGTTVSSAMNVACSTFIANGSLFGDMENVTATQLAISGCTLTLNSGSTTTVSEEMVITGCDIDDNGSTNYNFAASAANVKIVFSSNSYKNADIRFDGDGNTDIRLTYNGNNSRTTDVTFEDIAHYVGSGNIVFSNAHTWINCDTTLNFSCNTLRSCTIDFQATCAARGLFACNVGSALTFTNNATDVQTLLANIDTGATNHTS